MSKIVNIQPVNPITFEYQTYSPQDESLISSFEVTNNFNVSSSYIEYFIYDLNNTIYIVMNLDIMVTHFKEQMY